MKTSILRLKGGLDAPEKTGGFLPYLPMTASRVRRRYVSVGGMGGFQPCFVPLVAVVITLEECSVAGAVQYFLAHFAGRSDLIGR